MSPDSIPAPAPPQELASEQRFLALVRAGVFRIDPDGTIWRLKQGRQHGPLPRQMGAKPGKDGYHRFGVLLDGKAVTLYVHRVVWIWFKGPIPDGMEVNHKNLNKSDCAPSNLELTTHQKNVAHAGRHGKMSGGGVVKLNHDIARECRRRVAAGEATASQLAAEYGVSYSHMSAVIAGKFLAERGPSDPPPVHKLNLEIARECRRRWLAGGVTIAQLAREHGVSGVSMLKIVRGRSYAEPE